MNGTETQRVGAGALPFEGGGRSVAEAIGAIATVILAIIGLAWVDSNLLAAIATIVIGASIVAEGWSLSSSFRQFAMASAGVESATGTSGTMSADFLGGLAGIVLGILAIFGKVAPLTLLAVALLVFGATLVLSTAAQAQLNWRSRSFGAGLGQSATSVALPITHSGHLLVGLGAVVLGILAVVGLAQITLILVGLLSLGAAMLVSQFS
ncbi:MAG TPA: hypothetical protein VMU04_04985 [Candidatus Acidoferrum sp.]|nr:hypothetical protein [Candidatus Acidoferrum sp.]